MTVLTSNTVNKVNVNEMRATTVIPQGSISTCFYVFTPTNYMAGGSVSVYCCVT